MTAPTANGDAHGALLPLAVGPVAAASLVGVSRRTWDRLTSAGLTPAPVRIGACRRWSVETLNEWVEQGCPPQERLELTKKSPSRLGGTGRARSRTTPDGSQQSPRMAAARESA